MRLKYYLRGAGIGMIITAVVLMIGNRFIPERDEESTEISTETEREPSIAEALENKNTETETDGTEDTEEPGTDPTETESFDGSKPADVVNLKETEDTESVTEASSEDREYTQTTEIDTEGRTVVTVHEHTGDDTEADEEDTEKNPGNTGALETGAGSTESADGTETSTESTTIKQDKTPVTIRIDRGDGPTVVATRLAEAGLVPDAESYVNYLKASGQNDNLEIGEFTITPGSDFKTITRILTTNEYERRRTQN